MPREEPRFGKMVRVFTSPSIPEGHLVKGLLQTEGIPVEIKGESEGPYRMGPVDLWVPEAFEVQARLLIEEAATALDDALDDGFDDDLDDESIEGPAPPDP